jgi:hypothetical protein
MPFGETPEKRDFLWFTAAQRKVNNCKQRRVRQRVGRSGLRGWSQKKGAVLAHRPLPHFPFRKVVIT